MLEDLNVIVKKIKKCSVNKQFVKLENAIYNLHLSVVNNEILI